jgi:glycosyltransferase involved in cell wall biosynthesis
VKLRIAHVTATFPPYQTGTGIVAFHNAAELARRGHELHVFTTSVVGAPREETIAGVHVHRLRPWFKYGNAVLLPQLADHLRDFDVIHLHLPFYGGSEAVWALAATSAIPLVTTHHQDVVLPGLPGQVARLHDHLFGRKLMAKAQFACFTSLDYANYSRFTQSVSRSAALNVTELPNGVDVHRFSPGPPDERLRRALDCAGCRLILFVGALDRPHYFKGVDRLLEATRLLAREDIFLAVVGSGDLRDAYRRRAAELGLSNRVVFPGYVADTLLPDYYRLADVTVLPSVTTGEAFGLVLLESLACATPVIASNLPGVRTVVADGVDGYLATPGDMVDLTTRLDHLLSLPDEARRAMGAAGRHKVVAQYSWGRIGDLLEGLYMEIAKRKAAVVKRAAYATGMEVSRR